MYYYEISPNTVVRAGSDFFTYFSNEKLQRGQIVTIPVGKKQVTGVVLSEVEKPLFATKKVTSITVATPLPDQLVRLAIWIAKYYATPLATVWQTVLPRGLNKSRRQKMSSNHQTAVRKRTNIVFNTDQEHAIKSITNSGPGTYLLQGITGSGKTEVYIRIAEQMIAMKKSVIILVPEIALTSQIIDEFSSHFNDILVTHSGMTESERHLVWLEALNSELPRVVIGPRSALFTPLKQIGAIIIDEAHEPGYKQDQSPRYSALRVGTMLGRFHKSTVILGSATPGVVERYLASNANNSILRLDKLAKAGGIAPIVSVVDMKDRSNFKGHRFLSKQLIEQIEQTLSQKKQTLIFHNRRGSASTTLCEDCGWTAECPVCFLPMTLHSDKHLLDCHVCGYAKPVPTSCPNCHGTDIIHKGIGTKLIETELAKLFPNASVARFDADNKRSDTVNERYADLYDGSVDILIGTQVVAKGLDLPNLRTVGIIQADTGLSLPDFYSDERTFQLIAQAVGRVGRDSNKTQVILQTYQPDHPSIKYGLSQNYESFYENVIQKRNKGRFPPYTYLLKLTCAYKTEAVAVKNAKSLAILLRQKSNQSVKILGPTPAFYERQNGLYRWQLVLKSPKREYLTDLIKLVPTTHWQFDIDPTSLL